MSVLLDLQGKHALITGVSSGIGLGIAQVMAQAGCDIAGCGLHGADSDEAQAFTEAVQAHGQRSHYSSLNLCNTEALQGWVKASAQWLGGVDFVISNAGASAFHGAENCTIEEWQSAMNLNLMAHWQLSKAVKPYLLQASEAVIVIITSNHAYNTIPGCFPYNVAKAGLLGLVQSLAIEWGPKIRSVGIAPGFIDTPGGDAWFNSFADPSAERARTEAMHPTGRIGRPEEIGGLCAFLCSPYGRFITGTTLLADGGRSALMQDN